MRSLVLILPAIVSAVTAAACTKMAGGVSCEDNRRKVVITSIDACALASRHLTMNSVKPWGPCPKACGVGYDACVIDKGYMTAFRAVIAEQPQDEYAADENAAATDTGEADAGDVDAGEADAGEADAVELSPRCPTASAVEVECGKTCEGTHRGH